MAPTLDHPIPCDLVFAHALSVLQSEVPETFRWGLELDSGSGEQMMSLGKLFRGITWTPSTSKPEQLKKIEGRIEEERLYNIHKPCLLDVSSPWSQWNMPSASMDVVLSLHPSHSSHLLDMLEAVSTILKPGGKFVFRGPSTDLDQLMSDCHLTLHSCQSVSKTENLFLFTKPHPLRRLR